MAERAVTIAREKAAARGVDAHFLVADALRLDGLGQVFDTVLNCGLLHTFDSDERQAYAASLASVVTRRGKLYVLCFSDLDPQHAGPHPVAQHEITAAFNRSTGWAVASVRPDRIQARFARQGAPAWLAKIDRIASQD